MDATTPDSAAADAARGGDGHLPTEPAAADAFARPIRPTLPRLLVADDGRHQAELPGLRSGVLLRDIDLTTLVVRSGSGGPPLAVDIDGVRGLEPDDAAVDFVVRRLGIGTVVTRRPSAAVRVAELGGLALLRLLAFDSTGLRRSLEGHPRVDGVGSVVSPGLVLGHMLLSELAELPRPILGYGLLTRPADIVVCLRLADAVAVRYDTAQVLARLVARRNGRSGLPIEP